MSIIWIIFILVLIKNSSYPKPNKSSLKASPVKSHWLPDLKSQSAWNGTARFHSSTCTSWFLDSALCLRQLTARELPQGFPAPSTPESLQHCIDWALRWHSNYGPCSGFLRIQSANSGWFAWQVAQGLTVKKFIIWRFGLS